MKRTPFDRWHYLIPLASILIVIVLLFLQMFISSEALTPSMRAMMVKLSFALVLGIGAYWLTGTIKANGQLLNLKIQATGGAAMFIIAMFFLEFAPSQKYYDIELALEEAQKLEGFWKYKLYNQASGDRISGAFRIDVDDTQIKIPTGRSYYSNKGEEIEERGNWHSKAVVLHDNQLYIIFQLQSISNRPVAGNDSEYTGIVELNIIDIDSMHGVFNDLGLRRTNYGIVDVKRAKSKNLPDAIKEAYEYAISPNK